MSLLQCHQSNSDPTKFSFHKRDPVFITIFIETEITHSYFCHFCIHTNGFHVFIYFVIFTMPGKMLNPTFLCVFFVLLCARFLESGFEAATVTTTFSFVLAVRELLLTCDPLVAGTD